MYHLSNVVFKRVGNPNQRLPFILAWQAGDLDLMKFIERDPSAFTSFAATVEICTGGRLFGYAGFVGSNMDAGGQALIRKIQPASDHVATMTSDFSDSGTRFTAALWRVRDWEGYYALVQSYYDGTEQHAFKREMRIHVFKKHEV